MRYKNSSPIVAVLVVLILGFSSVGARAGFKQDFADLMNLYYGKVCHVSIEGVFTKTIRVDWTSETVVLHTIKVFAEISDAKERLYRDGVRYFKFLNDAGTYNIIDWKTGEKKSNSERARYYFSG